MKKLFALLAGALCFGVVAADLLVTPERVKQGGDDPFTWITNALAQLSAADEKAQLANIADAVKESKSNWIKEAYATALTVVYSKENPEATYDQLLAEQTKNFKELGLGEPIANKRISFLLAWFRGTDAPKSVLQAAYEANKEIEGNAMVTLCAALGMDLETEIVPRAEKDTYGRNWLFYTYGNQGNWERAAHYFWPLLNEGTIILNFAIRHYPGILNYELNKEDFDAAALKSKLTRAILVYRAKARTWKPTKEGESNPYVEFVGMLQDTAKDLQ